MTRKSKREIERVLDDLADDSVEQAGPVPIAEAYPDELRDFVYQVTRDLMPVFFDHDLAVEYDDPELARRLLAGVREEYGIQADRDDDVLDVLQRTAGKVNSQYWTASDTLAGFAAYGPVLLDEGDRERLDELVDAGDEDEAARIIVDAVYHWLADGAPDRRLEEFNGAGDAE